MTMSATEKRLINIAGGMLGAMASLVIMAIIALAYWATH